LFAALFAALLVYSFRPGRRPAAGKSGRETLPAAPAGSEAGEATTVLKGFNYTETVGGKPLFHIQSERTVGFGPAAGLLPNLYALEKVTLTVYPEKGDPVTVHADRATYDHRTNEAHLTGNVRWVDGRGALGETEKIDFQPAARRLLAPEKIRLSRGSFALEASSGEYDVAKREARLVGPVRGNGSGDEMGGLSALSADGAVYRRDESLVELAGSVSAASKSGSRLQTDRLLLKMVEEGSRLDWARAEGRVRGRIAGDALPGQAAGGAPRPPQDYAGDHGGMTFSPDGSVRSLSLAGAPATLNEPARRLRANSIEVAFDGGRARTAKAQGSVRIESEGRQGEADAASMALTPAGTVESLDLSGSVRMISEGRSATADHAVEIADRSVWILTGAPGRSATAEGDGSKVSAARIEIDQKRKNLRAEGGARAVLTSRQNGSPLATPVGDRSKPVFARADRMTFDDTSRVATLSGNATLWQDASSVFGNDVTLNDAERTLVAVGNTRTVFAGSAAAAVRPTPAASASRRGSPAADRRPSVVTAHRLTYREAPSGPPSPAARPSGAPAAGRPATAVFDGTVVVTSADWRASSNQAVAEIGAERRLEKVTLTGEVVMTDAREGRSGRADRAVDWPAEGKTVLEGAPASVVDREGNRVTGATLTITKRGGSVEVTAPEGGRTETIHKTRSS
ncbi:MAG: LPS export ABC transporter periplasmic protein LptC, partial [Acidobacteriota bacterium]